jgi:peptide/nickel transport system substrate-binding protein
MEVTMLQYLKKSAAFGLAAIAGAALALGALDAKPAKAEGTLIWAMPAAMSLFDPLQSCGWLTKNATHMMFDGLVELELGKPEKAYATLRPSLAESWTISDDGLVYTFNLRKGVKFHDGSPFNAEVASWNYDRFLKKDAPQYSPVGAAFLDFYGRWVASTKVIDEYTYQVTLKGPNYEWLQVGQSSCGQPEMISPVAYEKYGEEDIALNPVGTGPFKFVKREIDVMVVLERNEDYYGEAPKLDRIVFRQITDPATRMSALRAGEVHMVTEPTWDEIENVVEEGFTLLLQENVPSVWYAQFNMKNPLLKDVRVRRAINMAINREGIANEILFGTGHAEHGILSAGAFAYDPTYKPYPYDPEGAKKLLAEAGYADGLDLTMEIFDYGWNEAWEKWVQRDLKKVGINLKLSKLEWMTYLGKWLQGMPEDIAMNTMGWGWSVPYWTAHATRCDHHPPNGINGGWYCNEQVDDLYQKAIATRDQSEATGYYREANRIIMEEDVAFLPVFSYHNPILLAPNVKGFVNGQENWYDFTLPYIE